MAKELPPTTMRAARFHGCRDIRIDEIPEPECRPGHVKIAPAYTGLCGSDLHFFLDKPMEAWLQSPHPITGEKMPATFGHEFAGKVTEIGTNVSTLKVGDLVAVMPVISDGTCSACLRGSPNVCPKLGFQGYNGWGGGLSDAVVCPEASCYVLPKGVGCDVGALIEPLAVAWHAVRNAGPLPPTPTALIHGAGPIGIAVLLCLRAQGIKSIIVSEPDAARAAFATTFGATLVMNPLTTDLVASVTAYTSKTGTDGGVDVVFDCAGLPSTLASGIRCLKPLSVFVNVAMWAGDAPLPANECMHKEVTYRGSVAYTPRDFEEVVKAVAEGRLEPGGMVTKRIRLEDVVKEGFEELRVGGGGQCKILVDLGM